MTTEMNEMFLKNEIQRHVLWTLALNAYMEMYENRKPTARRLQQKLSDDLGFFINGKDSAWLVTQFEELLEKRAKSEPKVIRPTMADMESFPV